MKLTKVQELLNAKIHYGAELVEEIEIADAFGSDLMSDVLAFVKDQSLLLTGLVNGQVVRTAEMMDIKAIVFVRGKKPDELVVSLAEENGIILMCTDYRMYTACGLLYNSGLSTEGGDKV